MGEETEEGRGLNGAIKTENLDARTRIVFAMIQHGVPMMLQEVAEATHMTHQRVGYHLRALTETGVVYKEIIEKRNFYTLQRLYMDEALLKQLTQKFYDFLTPFVEQGLELGQVHEDYYELAVLENLLTLIKILASDGWADKLL